MSKRSSELLISDIIEAIDKINRYVNNIDFDEFVKNDLVQDAVSRNFTVIGEAANRLPSEFRDMHASVDWVNIISFRNRVVHEYFGTDQHITWKIITSDLTPLKHKLQDLK